MLHGKIRTSFCDDAVNVDNADDAVTLADGSDPGWNALRCEVNVLTQAKVLPQCLQAKLVGYLNLLR